MPQTGLAEPIPDRHIPVVAEQPESWRDDQCRDLKRGVRDLLDSLRRNRERRRLAELTADDQAAIRDCHDVVEYILWKLAFHYRSDVPMVEAAVMEARAAFSEYMLRLAYGPFLDRWLARMSLSFRSLHVWLFLRLQRSFEDLETGVGAVQFSAMRERNCFPPEISRQPDPLLVKVSARPCQLKNFSPRNRLDREQRAPGRTRRRLAAYCARACDLLLLKSLGFRVRDMEEALGIDHSTIQNVKVDCELERNRLHQEQAAVVKRPSNPPANSLNPHA